MHLLHLSGSGTLMSDPLFASEIETVPVKAEHLTEGMIVLTDLGPREVSHVEVHYNPFVKADDVEIRFTNCVRMWSSVGSTLEVEC